MGRRKEVELFSPFLSTHRGVGEGLTWEIEGTHKGGKEVSQRRGFSKIKYLREMEELLSRK